ncbi:MAG TPA: alpha/beta hydrolase, partial [Dehalococcoidia bacterium]|nr:alpha/beta hydrolase [Dehalococcoidia bacterium]
EGPAFDVIVPSLPGYAFSEPPKQPGMHLGRIAERMHLLMRDLGYERYGVQGGDWGAAVGSRLAQQHPEAVIGLHLNFAIAPPPPLEELSDDERAALRDAEMWRMQETAYAMLQGTKPQTLAYALVDSPTGLLAWILEKFWAWSDHGDDLWQTFEKDAVLANVSLYWFTNTVLSAARTYYEARRESPAMAVTAGRVEVPTAFANFPAEPFRSPRAAIERAYNLVRWTDQQKGGHFAAMEQPELFAKDVAEFFASL